MKKRLYLILKRFLDIVFAFLALLIFTPFLLLIGLIIKCESKGPVFFKQNRVGKNRKIFRIIKFRSMKAEAPNDAPTHLLHNPELYITKFGHFIRKTSIDELPQLINIIIGDMSIIGPRPALWNQADLVAEREKCGANFVRPGLSGWAQIHGRDELEIPEKAKLDGYYVKNISLLLDTKILFLTFFKVFRSEGIKEGDH